MTTNFARKWVNRVQPHKSTPYPQCFWNIFCSFSYYLVIIEQWVTLILSWTSETVFVCICISLSIFFFLTRGDVMSPLRHSRMIASHSKVPVSTRARVWE